MMVVNCAPKNERTSAFGVFSFFSGLAAMVSGLLAGFLWDEMGPIATFVYGATLVCVTAFIYLRHTKHFGS